MSQSAEFRSSLKQTPNKTKEFDLDAILTIPRPKGEILYFPWYQTLVVFKNSRLSRLKIRK